jgi:DNA-binding response OmpR family regulator
MEKTVLIVDDYEPLRSVLDEIFSLSEFHVLTASDSEEALDHLDTAMPDVLILDNHLSGQSGVSMLSDIRRRPGGSKLTIILVTGDSLVCQTPEAMLADLVLLKPFNIPELVALAERLAQTTAVTVSAGQQFRAALNQARETS